MSHDCKAWDCYCDFGSGNNRLGAPVIENMHPATEHVLQFFEYGHLRGKARLVALEFCTLARMVAALPENAETTHALRKLLEAKDCAVRAVICAENKLRDNYREEPQP